MHAALAALSSALAWGIVCCLLTVPGTWGSIELPSVGQEAFIGWRGETYLPPPASPKAAAAAEPLLPDTSAVHAPPLPDTAEVDQLQDIPAAVAPSAHGSEAPASPAAAPTVAASQHTIDVSALGPHATAAATSPHGSAAAAVPWVQHLSWHPRLHLFHNMLTPLECDKMRELLARPSGTVGGAHTIGTPEEEEAALMLMIDVEQRVANWTALPPNHLEGWQLQHGFTNSDTVLHTDLLTDRLLTEDYQRYRSASVLLFLGDQEEMDRAASSSGSSSSKNWSIVFPAARGGAWRGSAEPFEYTSILEQGKAVQQKLKASQVGRRGSQEEVLKLHINVHESLGSSSSDGLGFCDGSVQAGLTLTGFKRGDALLIWNMLVDGETPDASAAHLFCVGDQLATRPWIATTWMHNLPYGQDNAMALASVCEDTNPACSMWAAQGFCDDAPGLMIGLRGMCRRSCQDCRSCDSLRPVRDQQQKNSPADAASSSSSSSTGANMPSLKAYMECVYSNMRSLRAEWSEGARGAGVRKARNAIRRDMRFQAANGIIAGHASPSQQQSSWANVW